MRLIKYKFGLTAFAFIVSLNAFAQDTTKTCLAKYVVDAGPEIDVCMGGSVGLSGIVSGDATRGVWRGGAGTFEPNRNTLAAEYTPDTSEYGKTVVLTLVADNPKFADCPKARSLTRINVNLQPKVSAGDNQQGCLGKPIQLTGKLIDGKAQKLEWTTSGTGKFNDASKANAIYTPSENDAGIGAIRLTFKAIPYGVCLPDSESIAITVKAVPMIELPTLLNGKGIQPVVISGKADQEVNVSWTSNGTGKFEPTNAMVTTYMPSEDDLKKGTISLNIKIEKEGLCDIEKSIVLKLSAVN